jgi:hypothetical protein
MIRQAAAMVSPQLEQLSLLRFFGANLTTGAGTLTGSASLATIGPQQAADLVALAKTAIARLLDIPGINFTPAASVLRGVQMEARGDRATFAGAIKVSTIEALLEFVPALEGMGRDMAGATPAEPGKPATADLAPTPTVEPIAPEPAAKPEKHSHRKSAPAE